MFNNLGDLAIGDGYRLPLCGNRICYWGGSSGGEVDLSGAMGTIQGGENRAIQAQDSGRQWADWYLSPYMTAGHGALDQWAGLMGIPGYSAIDQTQMLENTPGYQFLQRQGNQGLARYGAATGQSLSGAAAKGALDYNQGLAQKYAWQPYMSSLQNLAGIGASTSGQMAGLSANIGNAEAGTYMSSAQQQANLAQQQALMNAQIQSQNQNSWTNDLFSGLGFGASLALAPFTGGTSLIGALGSGLSSVYGALGGGGMSLSEMMNAGAGSYNAFSPAFGGGWKMMADGGPTDPGRPYIVGERGPELFIPNVPGYVIPNEFTRYSAFDEGYRRAA